MKSGENIILCGPLPKPFGGVAMYMTALKKILDKESYGYYIWETSGIKKKEYSFDGSVRSFFNCLKNTGRKKTFIDSSCLFLEYPSLRTFWMIIIFKIFFRYA